jgi:hypothetical protein
MKLLIILASLLLAFPSFLEKPSNDVIYLSIQMPDSYSKVLKALHFPNPNDQTLKIRVWMIDRSQKSEGGFNNMAVFPNEKNEVHEIRGKGARLFQYPEGNWKKDLWMPTYLNEGQSLNLILRRAKYHIAYAFVRKGGGEGFTSVYGQEFDARELEIGKWYELTPSLLY